MPRFEQFDIPSPHQRTVTGRALNEQELHTMGTCTAEAAAHATDWTTLIEHVSSGSVDAMLVPSNNGRVVLVSEAYLDQLRRLAGSDAARSTATVLSARETEVLALAAQGHTGVSIANELGLAVNTVAQHLVSARRKLGVRTTKDAIARAAELAETPGLTDQREPAF